MKEKKTVICLDTGAKLIFEGAKLLGYDENGIPLKRPFTRGEKKLLAKMAANLRQYIDCTTLYYAYKANGDDPSNDKISKMISKMPSSISDSIENDSDYGYRLHGYIEADLVETPDLETKNEAILSDSNIDVTKILGKNYREGRFTDLAGDYFGYYLNPNTFEDEVPNVWGAYIHIEKEAEGDQQTLRAYAIYGVKNDAELHSPALMNVFEQNEVAFQEAYWKYKGSLEGNDSRIFYAEGEVQQEGDLAVITLRKPGENERWMLLFSMKAYLKCKRLHQKDADDCQGGLGLAIAINATHETRCFRFGLVRCSCWKDTITFLNDRLKSQLRIASANHDAMWQPLKLDKDLDRKWHDWLMSQ